jgi:long-chain acyl-CoA synthetase
MAGQTVQRDGALLLTGGTGFVGMEILARYLERTDRPIYALVRAPSDAEAGARIRSVISSLFGRADAYRGRVVAIPADIESPELGLDRARRGSLAERVTDIIHAAASVSFSLPLDESRQIYVEGTRRLLELAELCASRGGLARFSYISTAYVAGTHTGDFAEDQLEVGQRFRNSYELSKFEAERLVRSYRDRIPVQIFRPSIVVGERPSGWTASFNVLYTPLKAFARGAYPAIPARRSTPVDVVPTGPVGDDETYHLVSGREATTVGRLIDLAAARFDRRKPLVIPPRLYGRLLYPLLVRRSTGRRRRALERTKVFFPYFSMRVSYDDRRARSRLEAAGIRVSPLERYFDRLVEFAVRARWGRRALGRAEARRAGVARPRW